jgi:lipid II:glycine glycyltransferase (peptidoglycan interpeptide bridge formation enzyme)
MEISKKEWNARGARQEHAEFLQSYEWGEFQQALGRKVVREYTPQFFFSAIRMMLPLNFSYLYIPRGPVLTQENMSAWHTAVEKIAKEENVLFVRFEPVCGEVDRIFQLPDIKGTFSIQPKAVWRIDLFKDTGRLFENIHAKTRYNIRLAERKGVSIACAYTQEDCMRACETFLTLAKKTSRRHEFRLHPREYYTAMIRVFGENQQEEKIARLCIYTAEYATRIIAAALVIRFGDTAAYVHGGSDERYREVMAPHMLHWRIMQDMKAQGIHWYDMGGIDLSGDSARSWAGITRFKQGFGGNAYEYAGAYDLIFKKVHYTLYEWLRKIKRM